MPGGKCVFNDIWMTNEKYKLFLAKVDKSKAKCSPCNKIFDISNMGEAAITSHMASKKHKLLMETRKNNTNKVDVRAFFSKEDPNVTIAESSASGTVESMVSRNDVLKAEILWTLKVISSHYSYKSCENIQSILQKMFPDSDIVKHFSCGEKKCSYYCVFGIAPHFSSLLRDKVRKENGYVLLFDETLNKETQMKQLDSYVRLWDGSEVCTRYLGSDFLGHATADILYDKIKDRCSSLGLQNLHQLSMDGPYVNWKVFDLMMKTLSQDEESALLNVGSCGLHTIHNAFNDGCDIMPEIEQSLKALYHLFKDSPARREDFTKATDCDDFPLKFCKHRWLENVSVIERAIRMFPSIKLYVEKVSSRELLNPKNKSFEIVKSIIIQDPLFLAKCYFFISIAKEFEVFLTIYQKDQPMIPFLGTDLFDMLKELLQKFLKDEVIRNVTNGLQLLNVDIHDKKNHKDVSEIVIGFSATKEIKQLKKENKVNDKQIMELKFHCRKFLLSVSAKLAEKSPLKYQLVRLLSCLNPKFFSLNYENCITKFSKILIILVNAGKVIDSDCDTILKQFRAMINSLLEKKSELLESFDPVKHRVDTFFHQNIPKDCELLWKVIKILLLLSHGQSSVERGFSINQQIMVENLKADSIIAQRIVVDHVKRIGKVEDVELSKELMLSVSCARQRYMTFLENQKKEKTVQGEKRKNLDEDITLLKSKKKQIEQDVFQLRKSSEEYADKAEKKGSLALLAQSNALRRSIKSKEKDLSKIEAELSNKLLAHKNC